MNSDNPWHRGGLPVLNIAASCAATRALGPGLRAVVWVQGCPFRCPGCIAPEWIPLKDARLVRPEDLLQEVLAHPDVTGLTFSGGEPMLQAAGLATLARLSRQQRPLSVICFTGFRLEQLQAQPPGAGVSDLLAETDVLIDGLYVAVRNDNHGLRGSTNQRIHYLSDRLRHSGFDFAGTSRQAEIHIRNDHALLVGVPSEAAATTFHQALDQVNRK